MFLPTMTKSKWRKHWMYDFIYTDFTKQSKAEPSLIKIPFYQMGKCGLETICKWIHTKTYTHELEPYVSAFNWLSAVESMFKFRFFFLN